MTDVETISCMCGIGNVRECPDPESMLEFYFDCAFCDEFYEFTVEGLIEVKDIELKAGKEFFYDTGDYVELFVALHKFKLDFFDYIYYEHRGYHIIKLERIKR